MRLSVCGWARLTFQQQYQVFGQNKGMSEGTKEPMKECGATEQTGTETPLIPIYVD